MTLKFREYYTSNFKIEINNKNKNNSDVKRIQNYSQALGTLTKDQAHDFVFRLNEEERTTLYNTLEQFQMKEDKRKLECELFFSHLLLLSHLAKSIIHLMNIPTTPQTHPFSLSLY